MYLLGIMRSRYAVRIYMIFRGNVNAIPIHRYSAIYSTVYHAARIIKYIIHLWSILRARIFMLSTVRAAR